MKYLLLFLFIASCGRPVVINTFTESDIKKLCVSFCIMRNFDMSLTQSQDAYAKILADNLTQTFLLPQTLAYCKDEGAYDLENCYNDLKYAREADIP